MPQADEEPAPPAPAPEDLELPKNPSEADEKEAAHDDHEGPD